MTTTAPSRVFFSTRHRRAPERHENCTIVIFMALRQQPDLFPSASVYSTPMKCRRVLSNNPTRASGARRMPRVTRRRSRAIPNAFLPALDLPTDQTRRGIGNSQRDWTPRIWDLQRVGNAPTASPLALVSVPGPGLKHEPKRRLAHVQ